MTGDSFSALRSRIPKKDIQRATDAIVLPFYISIAQAALMVTYTVIFLSNVRASNIVFEKMNVFYGYIPILYRYGALFSGRGRMSEFHALFSIHLFNAILQSIVLVVLAIILYRRIRGRRLDRLGFKKNAIYFFALLFIITPSFDLFVGLGDLRYPGFFSNIYIRCFTVPVFNILLYFMIYARFWESHYRQLALSGGIENNR